MSKVILHIPYPKVPSGQVRSRADKSARNSLVACLSRTKTGLIGFGNRPDRFLCVAAQTGLTGFGLRTNIVLSCR